MLRPAIVAANLFPKKKVVIQTLSHTFIFPSARLEK